MILSCESISKVDDKVKKITSFCSKYFSLLFSVIVVNKYKNLLTWTLHVNLF